MGLINIDKKVILYHGSRTSVDRPNINYSREDIDFGSGFYLTEDETMAKKWACNKYRSFLNVYHLDFHNLQTYSFGLNEEWLHYCIDNRFLNKPKFDASKYDVLIGPTADDKMFNTLDMYADGLLSVDETLKILNCMDYSRQIAVKSQHVIDNNLKFVSSKEIFGEEKEHYISLFRQDRVEANRRTEDLIRNIKRRK